MSKTPSGYTKVKYCFTAEARCSGFMLVPEHITNDKMEGELWGRRLEDFVKENHDPLSHPADIDYDHAEVESLTVVGGTND